MWTMLCVVWAGTLLTFVSAAGAEDVTRKLEDIEARLSRLENQRGDGRIDRVDYKDFIKKDDWLLVFRATSGLGSPVYDTWTRTGYHDDYTYTRASMPCGCTSTNGSCDRHYRSRLLDSWPSSALDKVKLAVYEGGVEKAYMIFTGLGSNYINWFSADRLVQSSWKDLKSSAHNYFSIIGIDEPNRVTRRFYVSNVHNSCPGDKGWLSIKDKGHVCLWETADQIPTIFYSKSETMGTWETAGAPVGRAEVMAVWVKFRKGVDLTQPCLS
ncbi:uncharacterized protein LOC112570546 [Pomacea canaliculata]|uniref:uncharacterized protein LOC112570546 n=1 Tax=Pomacea canaliculata TaxID=400727 RepID=UPI000D726BB6|nr:uncharacterized protein LOC112570546 [Pomacea canaliculata]